VFVGRLAVVAAMGIDFFNGRGVGFGISLSLSLSLSLSVCAPIHLCVVFIFLNIQNLVGLLQWLRERE
jgi:hypothetical protein